MSSTTDPTPSGSAASGSAASGSAASGPARLFSFPNPVNELSARLVATGVVVQAVLFLVIREWWVLVPLLYGFLARVASGPRFSPLGLVVTKVIVPRLGRTPKWVPGPPKRFAQSIGLVFSATAFVLELAGADGAAVVVIAMLLVAASLEAFVGFCLGCWMFSGLMRIGVVPESVCLECSDITGRLNRNAA